MAQFPAMPLWTDAYLGDTTHLTTIEHGAYFLLLVAMWRNDGALPDDDKLLARYARLTAGQWARIKPVLMPFFDAENGEIRQGRLTDELEAVRQHSKKQSDNAKARWLKSKKKPKATAMPDECQNDAILNPSKLDTPSGVSSPLSPPKPSTRGTRLPDDWQPSQADLAFAQGEGLTLPEAWREGDRFGDYWRSCAGAKGVKRDWAATWKNWIRRVVDDKRNQQARRNGGNVASSPADDGGALGAVNRAFARFEGLSQGGNDGGL